MRSHSLNIRSSHSILVRMLYSHIMVFEHHLTSYLSHHLLLLMSGFVHSSYLILYSNSRNNVTFEKITSRRIHCFRQNSRIHKNYSILTSSNVISLQISTSSSTSHVHVSYILRVLFYVHNIGEHWKVG